MKNGVQCFGKFLSVNMEDPIGALRAITEDIRYSDVFVYAPVKSIAEHILQTEKGAGL